MTSVERMPDSRTRGITAGIEGFFALMWFGWAGAAAPSWLTAPIGVGSVASVIVAVAGMMLAARSSGQRTPLRDPDVRRRYNVVVGAEFAILGVGAAILAAAGLSDWITVWVCAGVGPHFLPLAGVVGDGLLIPLGLLITAAAAAALVVGLTTSVAPTTVTGPATGILLLAAATWTLSGRRGVGRLVAGVTRGTSPLTERIASCARRAAAHRPGTARVRAA